ncbi:TPA: SDR family NAD(P)-dependent oxidoreductase [Burkholderia cenocepacia]|uniref:SDR family NAD(P)-dependent oxidoreductase n=1 Tax=Burkholderia TaxID=32008 RepID=UPI00158EDCD6|nr:MULTISPECIES: SDR family NAD(P)-dependent oxidoreductase [Burkholderia]MBR8198399.1 SDR family NAD(P)-dependent oxidoreductase [Burkholderia cenocepacia]HDV6325020.1 SDR family NAD(P)-dependent oxidoreductase [Burkholderia cenocepacia]HDV6353089.1 SDR family NAD(P)-dependent oxidoreductase [Burkholderia cenocepacia]
MADKVWFITGASRGFGRIWAEAALARGDRVAATARQPGGLNELVERYGESVLPLAFDVTDPAQAAHVVAQAHAHFGRLDVVLNNAGYALVGAIEEANEEEVRAEFETNFFGTWRVIRAALPFLRQQGHGHIIGVSSVAGIVAGPIVGFYHASKWAFEAMHESLAKEVKEFGIKVTLLEPGPYATAFSSQASLKLAAGIDAYAALRASLFAAGGQVDFGDPQSTAQAVLQVVDAANPPLRLFLGTEGLPVARQAYAERLATWQQWEPVSNAAQGDSRRHDILQ